MLFQIRTPGDVVLRPRSKLIKSSRKPPRATTRNCVPRNYREPDMTLEEEDETQTPSSRDDERHPATGQAA